MCDPIILPTIMGVSAATGVGGSLLKMSADAQAADFEAAQARRNQQLANMAANDALNRGATEQANAQMRGAQVLGAQRAAYGASGVDVGTGTPTAVQASTQAMTDLDSATIRANAAREAWGYRNQGAQYGAQAGYIQQAKGLGTAASILGGVGSAATGFANTYKAGADADLWKLKVK